MKITRIKFLVVVALLVLAGQATAADLHDLDGLEDLQESFNGDTNLPRLVLLLSPT